LRRDCRNAPHEHGFARAIILTGVRFIRVATLAIIKVHEAGGGSPAATSGREYLTNVLGADDDIPANGVTILSWKDAVAKALAWFDEIGASGLQRRPKLHCE
jgi:hypothetical protein